jgi:hypothetical protein
MPPIKEEQTMFWNKGSRFFSSLVQILAAIKAVTNTLFSILSTMIGYF